MGWSGAPVSGFYGETWGDPLSTWWDGSQSGYDWRTAGAYDGRLWSTAYGSLNWTGAVGYGWWTDAGMVVPVPGVFDPFSGVGGLSQEYTGNYFANGFTGLSYGLWYGATFGYWYANWGLYPQGTGYSWLPNYAIPAGPQAGEEPAAAVEQQQATVDGLTAIVSAGKDVLAILKSTAPVVVQAASGLVQLGASAGFAAVALATDAKAADSQNGNDDAGDWPRPFTAAQIEEILNDQPRLDDLYDRAEEDLDPVAMDQVEQIESYQAVAIGAPDSWTATMGFNAVSGHSWDGRTILETIKLFEGPQGRAVADFVARHFRLAMAEVRDPRAPPSTPTIAITGPAGKPITSIDDINNVGDSHIATISLEIPRGWDSKRVAEFILKSLGDDPIINKIAQDDFAGQEPLVFGQLQNAAFQSAAAKAAKIAGIFYKTLAAFTPGAAASLAVYDLGEGDLVGAGLDVLFMAPVLHLAGNVASTVAVKVADKVIANIPIGLIRRFQKLGPVERETMLVGFRTATTQENAVAELEQLLKTPALRDVAESAAAIDGELANRIFTDLRNSGEFTVTAEELAKMSTKQIGDYGETITKRILEVAGYKDIKTIQNASGNGLDVIARLEGGQWVAFEVKTSTVGRIPDLSERQAKGVEWFVNDILSQASVKGGRYKHISNETRDMAKQVLKDFQSSNSVVTGNVVGVDLKNGKIVVSEW